MNVNHILRIAYLFYKSDIFKFNVSQDNAEGMYSKHWVNMTGSDVHDFLSTHSQAAEAIEPGFIFPFYGHLVNMVFLNNLCPGVDFINHFAPNADLSWATPNFYNTKKLLKS